jgi:hypothetical protein
LWVVHSVHNQLVAGAKVSIRSKPESFTIRALGLKIQHYRHVTHNCPIYMSDKQNNSISDKRKRQDIQFAQKDEALRDDVHALGEMIGEMLVEQGGEALYKSVESARRLAIGRRAGNVEDREKLDKMLSKMSTSAARDVA